MQKKAIIIGASSGIGKALAYKLAAEGYALGLTARRYDLLKDIQQELSQTTTVFIERMDVADYTNARTIFRILAEKLGGVDLVHLNAGIGHANDTLDAALEIETINTNATGFANLACEAFRHFQKKGHGHLIGTSSVLMVRGNPVAPAYGASKALISHYMESLRIKALKLRDENGTDITVTDIRPGFVNTAMAKGEILFWVVSPEIAADQIYSAICKKKNIAYVTRRWWFLATLARFMPLCVLKRL